MALAFASQALTISMSLSPVSFVTALRARTCSAPISSVVSERIDAPHISTSLSET